MKKFKKKVAVITGAASGIGRGIAKFCVSEGMKVVLADINKEALTQNKEELERAGASVLAVLTDVSKASDMEALARKTLDVFGEVHLLFNNAGVIEPPATVWESTAADWTWVTGVNLWSVIHGIRIFIPVMLDQNTESHVVNTASVAGFRTNPGAGIYRLTKCAIVSLSETLYHELAQKGAKVRVSVLCPGLVNTQIADSARNRPIELRNDPVAEKMSPEHEQMIQNFRQSVEGGISPDQIADHIFKAIRNEKFYIFTHPEIKDIVRTRMEDILQERNPTISLV